MSLVKIKDNLKGMEDQATAIIVCDKNLKIQYINPSAEILFELSHISYFLEWVLRHEITLPLGLLNIVTNNINRGR